MRCAPNKYIALGDGIGLYCSVNAISLIANCDMFIASEDLSLHSIMSWLIVFIVDLLIAIHFIASEEFKGLHYIALGIWLFRYLIAIAFSDRRKWVMSYCGFVYVSFVIAICDLPIALS